MSALKSFVVVRDGFGENHACAHRRGHAALAEGAELVDALGLNDRAGVPFRVGTVEASDAGAARLAHPTRIRWVGSFTFEADGVPREVQEQAIELAAGVLGRLP